MSARSLLIALAVFLALSFSVYAEGGSIQGRLVNGTDSPPRPLAAHPVQLYAESQGEKALQETLSDADGHFVFQGLDPNSQEHYVIGAEYTEVAYYSDWIVLTPITPTVSISLPVYETTTSDSGIVMQPVHLLVSFSEGKIRVQEIVFVENQSARSYIGQPEATLNNRLVSLRFSLPKEATELEFADASTEDGILRMPEGFVETRPVSPGRWSYIYSYSLNYTGAAYDFHKTLFYPLQNLNLLVADTGVSVESQQLVSKGRRETQSGAFLYWSADSLARGSELLVSFRKLPPGGTVEVRTPHVSALRWVALGLLALLAALAISYPFWKRPAAAEDAE
jgi:hypothetical protein